MMKTEKRKAEIGEKVVITKAASPKYATMLEVTGVGDLGISADGLEVDHCDYEVVLGLADPETAAIKPDHYHAGGIDVFTYAEANYTPEEVKGYHKISAHKYISRAGKKEGNSALQDFQKAKVHIEKLIELEGLK